MTKRIAVIGAGYWGKNIVRNYRALGALAMVCEPNEAAHAALNLAGSDVSIYSDPENAFCDPAIDAVAIATPAVTHGTLVSRALSAGKDVFVEKPLCLDRAEAGLLRDAARKSGRILMVGHMLLYHPAFVALRKVLREGRIGRLRYIYSTRLSLGKIRREENALWSFAPHDISMILALTGSMPKSISAYGQAYLSPGVADTTLSHMTFEGGFQAHIFVSWLHPYKEQRLVVVGESGMVVFNDMAKDGDKLLIYPHHISVTGEFPTVDKADAVPIPFTADEPLACECRAFLTALESREAPLSDAEEGMRVLEVLDACQRALDQGHPVSV